ncbi:MAG: hypothetical protein ACJ73D_01480 [Pyrinomonadaceae bacterium]
MQKPLHAEETDINHYRFCDVTDHLPLEVVEAGIVAIQPSPDRVTKGLDVLVTLLKWTFVYGPGVALMQQIMIGLVFFNFYREPGPDMDFGAIGAGVVSIFLIMMGIGRLSDLRYLLVVGAVTSVAFVSAAFCHLAMALNPHAFGLYLLASFLLISLAGYLTKRSLDGGYEAEGLDPASR